MILKIRVYRYRRYKDASQVKEMYRRISRFKIFLTDSVSAETVKYTINNF